MKVDKYYDVRGDIQNGDIILYRSSTFIGKAIRYFDNAEYDHIDIQVDMADRKTVVSMGKLGIEHIPLSKQLKRKRTEFRVLRPKQGEIKESLDKVWNRWERDISYDYWLLPRGMLQRKLGIDLTRVGSKERDVCSELVQRYTDWLGINSYKNINLISPQDFMRYMDGKEMEVIVA